MRLSTNGRKFLMHEEGLSLTAYPDPKLTSEQIAAGRVQKYSIGYGHSGAYRGQTITRAEAEALLVSDIVKYETAVSLTTPRATQAQFDAMVALCYNIGTAGFAGSTVARLHDLGDYAGAANAFAMWRNSAGAVDPRLVARRARETTIYRGGGYPGVDTSWSPSSIPVATTASSVAEASPLAPLAVAACAALCAYWALPKVGFARRALSIAA